MSSAPGDVDVELVRRHLTAPAYHRWLGLELLEATSGRVVVGMPYREELLADPDGTYVHGGLLATLADVAGDFALVTRLGTGVPTVDLRVDYLRPALPGRYLRGVGTVVRCGRQLGVADATVLDDGDKELAVARGVYATGAAQSG